MSSEISSRMSQHTNKHLAHDNLAAEPSLDVALKQLQGIPLDVRFSCHSGELLALTGPSGSGKSTVLRTIAGLAKVESGRVLCNGSTWLDTENALCRSPQNRRVGLVFQEYALFPHLSVQRNLTLAMGHIADKRRASRSSMLLEMVNMSGLEQRRPATLSGGQKQRVALARALARDPDVLLLDEQLRTRLEIPVLLVTHDMREVQQLADKLVLIHRGTSLQSGPVETLMRYPDSPAVARLLGHQNLFEANDIKLESDHSRIQLGEATLHGPLPEDPKAHYQSLLIPEGAVVMHRNDRPSRGERENPLNGQVSELTILGDDVALRLQLAGVDRPLSLRISRHVANRNGVQSGSPVSVSILREGIHLMKGKLQP